mgnify:CR=1 FL=1
MLSLLLKRERLAAMREEIAADAARIGADGRALDDLKRRQQADVEEWQQCAYLDNSFADCSATVNRDARRMMIQLLIDNTTRAADEADKELETYNFHQGHINRLNEEIDVLKAEMETNQTYLDNVRTAARIAAASAVELQQVINESDRACSELYTDLSIFNSRFIGYNWFHIRYNSVLHRLLGKWSCYSRFDMGEGSPV